MSQTRLEPRSDFAIPSWTKAWTVIVGFSTLAIGLWTFFLPESFFENFPIEGANWVSTLGAFNEHLTRDYGAAEVGLGLAAIGVGLSGSRMGIVSVLSGYVVFGVFHLGYHLGTFEEFSTASALTQGFSLATFIAIPAMVLMALLTTKMKGIDQ